MNSRKSIYFKPLCLLVAALFTCQCFYMERKLISTEEKVIENGSQGYVYEFERIKTPSNEDHTVEYKIVKFPAKRIELINTYQNVKKVNRSGVILGGFLLGALTGFMMEFSSSTHEQRNGGIRTLLGTLTGGLLGLSAISINKGAQKVEIKMPTSYLEKKLDSTSIPVQDFPLEFKLGSHGKSKSNSFRTQTDEQGIVRINLVDDLKMTKFPFDQPLTLFILYFNPESQRKGIFKDSLGPEK